MIRLSKLADYAFVILTQMVASPKGAWSAADLAGLTSLPLPTVAKVLKLLAKSGILTAQRGAAGGYRLVRPATETTVAAVIEAVDGPIALTGCVEPHTDSHCAVKSFCALRGGWGKLNTALRGALETVTLAELSTPLSLEAFPPVARPNEAEAPFVQA